MTKTFEINGQQVEVSFKKHTRAKRLILKISHSGIVKVTVPKYVSHRAAQDFVLEKSTWISDHLSKLNTNNVSPTKKALLYKESKKAALKLVQEKLAKYNSYYNFTYSGITIRNQQSIWGSCSRKGNLNFNYRILFLPDEMSDYIIVHELCHLKEMNHSSRFWDLVEKTIPNYKSIRKSLRTYEMNLF